MITFTRAEVMRVAWNVAKTAAHTFGGSSKQYFKESLKLSWKWFKDGEALKNENTCLYVVRQMREHKNRIEGYSLKNKYFSVLGLNVYSTIKQVKIAYKTLSLHSHPDKGGSSTEFVRIKEAYNKCIEILKQRRN